MPRETLRSLAARSALAGRAVLDSRGHVIITASLLSGVTMPFTAAYTVSKRSIHDRSRAAGGLRERHHRALRKETGA